MQLGLGLEAHERHQPEQERVRGVADRRDCHGVRGGFGAGQVLAAVSWHVWEARHSRFSVPIGTIPAGRIRPQTATILEMLIDAIARTQ